MANDGDLELTFRFTGGPEVLAALSQWRKAMGEIDRPRDISRMTRELAALRKSFNGISREIGNVVRPAMSGLALSLGGLVAGTIAAAYGLNNFSSGLVEIRNSADRVGLTIQQYRGFIQAALDVNITREDAVEMIDHFSQVVLDAQNHVHGAWEEIVRLGGADVVGAVLNAKSTQARMAVVWQRLEYLRSIDPAKARQWASLWTGNAKATRIEWSSAMEAMAHASMVSDEAVKQALEYRRAWVEASAAWDTIKQEMGLAAINALEPFVEDIARALSNKEFVDALASGAARLADVITEFRPEIMTTTGLIVGSTFKTIGVGLWLVASGLGHILDVVEIIEGRRQRGEPPLKVSDLAKELQWEGRFYAELDDRLLRSGILPNDMAGHPADIASAWRSTASGLLFSRSARDAGEGLTAVSAEFQKLVDSMRAAGARADVIEALPSMPALPSPGPAASPLSASPPAAQPSSPAALSVPPSAAPFASSPFAAPQGASGFGIPTSTPRRADVMPSAPPRAAPWISPMPTSSISAIPRAPGKLDLGARPAATVIGDAGGQGRRFDALADRSARVKTQNSFAVSLQSRRPDAAGGVRRIPSTIFDPEPRQAPIMPATGVLVAP